MLLFIISLGNINNNNTAKVSDIKLWAHRKT
jgi:hypothetical protein